MEILNDVFSWLYESLIEPFLILHSFQSLIFGEGRREDLVYTTFTATEITDIYEPGVTIMASVAGFFIVASIAIAGMRISSTAINPASRTYYIEFMKDLAIVAIIFFNIDFLYNAIFTLNSGIVNLFANAHNEATGISILEKLSGSGIIGGIIIGIIMLFLMLWANWYYMMRKLTLLILMIMGPLMIAFYLIPQFKSITGAWFKELVGTIFVQSIHAALFWVTALITAGNALTPGDSSITDPIINVETVILYLIFIPTGEAIRSLLGMGGGMTNTLSRAGAMLGLSALAGVYGSIKGALDKDNSSTVISALKGAKDGVKGSGNGRKELADEESIIRDATMAANTGTDTGTTPKADEMLKWGDIGSRAGKAILGSAGAIGGAAIGGPMGAIAASTGGFIAGGIAGGIAGRGTKALKDLAEENLKNGKNSFIDTWDEMSDPLKANQEDIAKKLADKETADYENKYKPSFIENAREKFPDLDDKGLEMKWQEHKNGIHADNLAKARKLVQQSTSSEGKLANATALANTSASEMTNRWAEANKAAFDKNYELENPLPANATPEDIKAYNLAKEKAWNQKVSAQQAKYQNVADSTAKQLRDKAMGSENISKAEFAKAFADNMQAHDKRAFIAEYQQQNPKASLDEATKAYTMAKGSKESFIQAYQQSNPNATPEQAEILFNYANNMSNGGLKNYLSDANSAIQNIRPETIFNKGANKQVNRGYLANQLASAKTLQDKSNFINEQVANGVSEEKAIQLWGGQEKQKFQENLSYFDKQLPQSLPMKQMIRRSETMQKLAAGSAATSAFLSNATGIKPLTTAARNAAIKGSLVTKSFVDGYAQGSQSILESPENVGSSSLGSKLVTQTKAVGSGIAKGIQNATDSLQPSLETAIEKQRAFQNAVAYTGGLVGGAKLYQKAGSFAARINPYNKVINSSSESGAYEVSEIRQMASRIDPETGQSYIPQGNIQLVSTPTQSYVQVTDSSGQKRIVSRYGAGDSALSKGQVVLQDLTIDDRGGLKPITEAYLIDTGGAKVSTGRNININPNRLIATNRPSPINPMVTRDVSPYNASVETGSFSKKEAIEKIENIRLIVTKERSYMVGNDKSTGQEVRISPYNQGDARLDANDVREVRYMVKNNRFNVEQVIDSKGNQVEYTPRMETHEYLYTPRNPRAYRRKQFEGMRFKGIGGAG